MAPEYNIGSCEECCPASCCFSMDLELVYWRSSKTTTTLKLDDKSYVILVTRSGSTTRYTTGATVTISTTTIPISGTPATLSYTIAYKIVINNSGICGGGYTFEGSETVDLEPQLQYTEYVAHLTFEKCV